MPRKAGSKSKAAASAESQSSLSNYFKFGESYTSLILGIVVVIMATILLLSFVHNKNVNKAKTDNQQILSQNTQLTPAEDKTAQAITLSPAVTLTATPTKAVTATPTKKPTVTPQPTEKKKITPTMVARFEKKATPAPTEKPKKEVKVTSGTTYTIVKGDTLWIIADKVYKDGYKWTEIARANNLSNPSLIHVGNKLKLPKIEQKNTAVKKIEKEPVGKKSADVKEVKPSFDPKGKITGTVYEVSTGDDLWDIAVRAYGDGHKWKEIAKANKLKNGNLIHPGNALKIPRGK